jgi:hypothetical protein
LLIIVYDSLVFSITSQQYFSLTPNQHQPPVPVIQQYFSLTTNHRQPIEQATMFIIKSLFSDFFLYSRRPIAGKKLVATGKYMPPACSVGQHFMVSPRV